MFIAHSQLASGASALGRGGDTEQQTTDSPDEGSQRRRKLFGSLDNDLLHGLTAGGPRTAAGKEVIEGCYVVLALGTLAHP